MTAGELPNWDVVLDTLEERQRLADALIHGPADAAIPDMGTEELPVAMPTPTRSQRLRVIALLDANQRSMAAAASRRSALQAARAYSR
jgi:hypothetical protein